MALLNIIQENIGGNVVVLYSDDGDDKQVEGVLAGIDSSKGPDDYPCFIVVDTEEGTESIPVNWIKQFFCKDSLTDHNAEFFYVVLATEKQNALKSITI